MKIVATETGPMEEEVSYCEPANEGKSNALQPSYPKKLTLNVLSFIDLTMEVDLLLSGGQQMPMFQFRGVFRVFGE